jgi:hypothetical protein
MTKERVATKERAATKEIVATKGRAVTKERAVTRTTWNNLEQPGDGRNVHLCLCNCNYHINVPSGPAFAP